VVFNSKVTAKGGPNVTEEGEGDYRLEDIDEDGFPATN
jgi:hypothetical protein